MDVKIKICGISREEDARALNLAMPDFTGFIFYEKSRRNVTPETARALRSMLDPRIVSVGVFVDAEPSFIAALYEAGIISVAQLHGAETEEDIAALRARCPGITIWKAFTVARAEDLAAAEKCSADRILLDSGKGSGELFDHSLLTGFRREFMLAGGLTPENIPALIEKCRPWGVDLSSGVETNGKKDKSKILAAVDAARNI